MTTAIPQMIDYSVMFLNDFAVWLLTDPVAITFVGLGFVSLVFGLVRKLV